MKDHQIVSPTHGVKRPFRSLTMILFLSISCQFFGASACKEHIA